MNPEVPVPGPDLGFEGPVLHRGPGFDTKDHVLSLYPSTA